MINIVIVGVGGVGKKHLSSIMNSKIKKNIYCIDINENALDDMPECEKKKVSLVKTITDLPKIEFDFALFSMTSKGRREMYDEMVNHIKVNNILFEKVLFQRTEDYEHVLQDLKKKEIKAWVNCARRQMEFYQNLRERLESFRYMEIHISGGEWGMACNAIHMLDLIAFISGDKSIKINEVNFLPLIKESKRPGYKEVYGMIFGSGDFLKGFSISCIPNCGLPMKIEITTENGRFIVREDLKKLYYMNEESQYQEQNEAFEFPYLSQMTQFIMEDILRKGTCRLTSFDESASLHLMMLKPLMNFFEENGMEKGICPIT